MNWSALLRFRKNVEDLIREEIVLAEWERSREHAKQEQLRREMREVAIALERNLKAGIGTIFAEQRYRWLERMGTALEQGVVRLHEIDRHVAELREKLKQAYHARRVIEVVIAKKEAALLREIAQREQRVLEEVGARAFIERRRADRVLEPVSDAE